MAVNGGKRANNRGKRTDNGARGLCHAPFRGTRDYECFSSDWLSSIAPLAGAIDHACDGYIGKSFVSPTW
jgi:hypothetical protein